MQPYNRTSSFIFRAFLFKEGNDECRKKIFLFHRCVLFSPFESIGRGKRGQITTRDHFFPTKGKKKIHFLRGEEAAEWNRPGYDLKRKKKLG